MTETGDKTVGAILWPNYILLSKLSWAGALSLMVASFPEKVYLFGPLSKLHGWKVGGVSKVFFRNTYIIMTTMQFPFKSVRNPWFILHSFPAIAGALSNTLNFWVMSVWGGASVLGSVAFGRLERYIPRSTLIIYAGAFASFFLKL